MGGGRSVMMYRSHSLQKTHSKATRALIVIHNASRNAYDYFQSGMAGAYLAGVLDDTIVVAPRFAGTGSRSCDDKLAPGEIGFACSGDDWRGGGPGVERCRRPGLPEQQGHDRNREPDAHPEHSGA